MSNETPFDEVVASICGSIILILMVCALIAIPMTMYEQTQTTKRTQIVVDGAVTIAQTISAFRHASAIYYCGQNEEAVHESIAF